MYVCICMNVCIFCMYMCARVIAFTGCLTTKCILHSYCKETCYEVLHMSYLV